VLISGIRRVGRRLLQRKVVPHRSCAQVLGGLRDQLRTPHAIVVPHGRGVDGDLCTLRRPRVRRVLVAGIEVDVVGGVAGTVDVPLILTDLVGPGPFVEVGSGGIITARLPLESGRNREGAGGHT
jgi:hypothetical protein